MKVCLGLVGLHYSPSSNAGSANTRSLMGSINNDADSLEIRIPSSLGNVVGMADIVSKQRALPTNITTRCHSKPPIKLKNKMVAEALPGVKLLKCQTARQGLVVHVDTGN